MKTTLKITGEKDKGFFVLPVEKPIEPEVEVLEAPPEEDHFYLYQEYEALSDRELKIVISHYLTALCGYFRQIEIFITHG